MVHPYLRRRRAARTVTYPSPEMEDILGPTLGVPLFQEQVMELVMHAADYTDGEADQLRRSMAAWRSGGDMEPHRLRVREKMTEKGYAPEFIEQIFEQIKGFGSYGFPQSHAASFAKLVLRQLLAEAPRTGGVRLRACSMRSRWASIRPARSCRTRVARAADGRAWSSSRST